MSANSVPLRLLPELLERLEASWTALGADVATRLADGASDAQLASASSEFGLLPEELRIWWRWHDGVRAGETEGRYFEIGPGSFKLLSVELALSERQRQISYAPESDDPDSDIALVREMYWHESWLPILGDDPVFVDLARSNDDGQCSLHRWDPEGDFLTPIAPSLTSAVSTWVELLEGGYYTWVRADWGGAWDCQFADLPETVRESGLV
jgi:cell wall assembly regulator SMI1